MKIVFFDVGRSLVDVNVGIESAKHFVREGRIGLRDIAKIGALVLKAQVTNVDPEEFLKPGGKIFLGRTPEEMAHTVEPIFEDRLKPKIFRDALRVIEEHKKAGDRVALFDTSPQELVDKFVEYVGAERGYGLRVELEKGRYSGRLVRPICYKEGKRDLALQYLEEIGASPADAVFYADSHSDLSLFEVVGEPVAVNPNKHLSKLLPKLGWKVLRFKETLGE